MNLARRDVLIRFGTTRWVARVDHKTTLRTLLREACVPVYNSVAKVVNCHGLGTCGTCAVSVSSSEPSPLTEASWREIARLSLPPHSSANTTARQLRLACQCRFARNPSDSFSTQLDLDKLDGIWGHRSPTTDSHCEAEEVLGWEANLDMFAIREVKPFFPAWLWQEMRSNHAGETGAVCIYLGCLDALALRRRLAVLTNGWRDYEDELQAFAEEHERSERMHLVWLNSVLDDRSLLGRERSMLLPAWRAAGYTLGFLSTIWCPRGMYVTTDAVETFVEEHYQSQIVRLKDEIARLDGGEEGSGERGGDTAKKVRGLKELLRMLELCCEDEVHHQTEARERAARGPLPWVPQVDSWWRNIVSAGSWCGAEIAKRV